MEYLYVRKKSRIFRICKLEVNKIEEKIHEGQKYTARHVYTLHLNRNAKQT